MKTIRNQVRPLSMTMLGSFLYAAGFSLFLLPNGINNGGVSGLAMIIFHVTGFASVGMLTVAINLPLFLIAGKRIGKWFFYGSIIGMLSSSMFIDALGRITIPAVEPVLACIYGGGLCGLGLGMVFAAGTSTGGTDILARLLKLYWRDVPIGTITMALDAVVIILTGLVFGDMNNALYSGIAAFIVGQVIDLVIYRFDYSKVALIISPKHEKIALEINTRLDRGATYLEGSGCYTGRETKVILTVVKKRQLAELKELVMEIDAQAFVIVQEAHQVLGDGFSRYHPDSL